MPPQVQRYMPSAGAQKSVFWFNHRDFVRAEIERFIALDEITAAAQLPPHVVIFGTQLTCREFDSAGRDVFVPAEVDLSGGIESENLTSGQMDGKSMNLELRIKDSRDVGCCCLPRQKLHEGNIPNKAEAVHNT